MADLAQSGHQSHIFYTFTNHFYFNFTVVFREHFANLLAVG